MNKERREIVYSIIIFVSIPVLVVVNTIFLSKTVSNAYNRELRWKSDMANTIIAESLREKILAGETSEISAVLDNLTAQQTSLIKLSVLKEVDGSIKQIARSSDADVELDPETAFRAQLTYQKQRPIANLVNLRGEKGLVRAWNITTPLLDLQTGKVQAVANSYVTTSDADELLDEALLKSFGILTISVGVIIVLLIRHLRFVEYARLLAKQREINQTMTDFLSVATHELKAPTTLIKGYVSNILEDYGDKIPEETKEPLNIALAQTDRLNNLVKDLLNVSRVEQGRIEYNLQTVDLTEIIKLIADNYKVVAGEKDIQIQYAPEGPHKVFADAGRVQEIFTNLIDNAVKYTPKGTVIISHQVKDNAVITTVRDSGLGMSSEQRKRLFQRFYRVQTEETRDISGTGLGLWIIKQYIEAMKGSIDVDSMPGVGTQFSVTLPASKES